MSHSLPTSLEKTKYPYIRYSYIKTLRFYHNKIQNSICHLDNRKMIVSPPIRMSFQFCQVTVNPKFTQTNKVDLCLEKYILLKELYA